MLRRIAVLSCLCLIVARGWAQDLKLGDHDIQVHGFVSQGFVYTSGNNWLTMVTNGDGSPGWTEMGLTMSTAISEKARIAGQVYDRNMGQLGQYHPQLDFAMLDYRFKPWFGVRVGKVKTTLGLFTDTQDLDFLRTFALLPQSVYPLDLRDADIAHEGGDVYGAIRLGQKRGALAYTAYSGYRNDSVYSGYPYFLETLAVATKAYGGIQWGGDLRYNTPLRGLLVGLSRLDEHMHGLGYRGSIPIWERTKNSPDFTNQFYGEYVWRNLRLDAEAKRFYRDHLVGSGMFEDAANIKGIYIAGSYRVMKHLELGSYYSRYTLTSTFFHLSDTNLPQAHDYDKAVTGRVDINRYWIVKVEGHFMNGYALGPYPNGFYPQENPTLVPNTNALVLKTGVNF